MENGIINWEEYFMGIAHLASMRSKDPNTKVGACIVDDNNKIVTIGYNGFPIGLSDDKFPWERKGGFKDTKYAYVVHAELNAILNSQRDVKGCTCYVTLFPCNECAKAIVQAGIKKVIYEDDKYDGTDGNYVSKKILETAGVKFEQSSHKIKLSIEVK